MPVFSRLSLRPLGEDHAMGQLRAILDQPAQAEVHRVVHNGRRESKNHVRSIGDHERIFWLNFLVAVCRFPGM